MLTAIRVGNCDNTQNMFHFRWQYHSPEELGSESLDGEISTYRGGGYYLDFKENMSETNESIQELYKGLWLDRSSRGLVLQFTTYNANENLFFTLQ